MSDLATNIAKLASGWMLRSGITPKHASKLTVLDAAIGGRNMTTKERVLRAAACDPHDTLHATPEGRQALSDLGFEPVSQDPKGE